MSVQGINGEVGFFSCTYEYVCVSVCKKQSLFNEQDVGQQGLSAALRDLRRERRRSVLLTRADLINLPRTPHPKHQVEGDTHTYTHTLVRVRSCANSRFSFQPLLQQWLSEATPWKATINGALQFTNPHHYDITRLDLDSTNKMEDKTLLNVISRTKESDMDVVTFIRPYNVKWTFPLLLNTQQDVFEM